MDDYSKRAASRNGLSTRFGRSRKRSVAVGGLALSLIIVAATTLALPAIGDEDFNTGFHDGICYWWGSAEWKGVWGNPEGTAKGVTSLWEGSCDKLRIKMQWANTSNNCVWQSWTGDPPAFSRSREGYHIDYSDADVRLGSTWYGFRVQHAGACTY